MCRALSQTSTLWWLISDFSRGRRSKRAFSASLTGTRIFIAPRELLDGDLLRRPPLDHTGRFVASASAEQDSGKVVNAQRKLLFVVTEDWYFVSHRLELAVAARQAGYDVAVATRVDRHGERIT